LRVGLFTRRRIEDRTLAPQDLPSVMLPDVAAGGLTTINETTWTQVLDVHACIKLLCDTISTLPLEPFRDTPSGRVEVGPDARISQLLRRPAPGQTLCDLVAMIVQSLLVDGNAFIGKFTDDSGTIVQLACFDPAMVQVRLHGQIVTYIAGYSGGSIETGPDDILHIRSSVTLDHLRGVSPITQCAMAMGLNASLSASAQNLMDQGSRPSGVLRVKGGQSEFTVGKISEQWDAKHRGALNHHKVAVVSADEIDFVQLGLNAQDSQLIQQMELSTRQIARLFGIPSAMIGGDTGRSMTYATQESEAMAFVNRALRPLLVRIEEAISRDPDLCPGQSYVRFDTTALLRASSTERAQFYTAALGSTSSGSPGWMTRDEVRAAENLGPEVDLPDVTDD